MSRLRGRSGSSLVIAIIVMAVLVITVLTTALTLSTLKRETIYQERLMQAEDIASGGLQDALGQLQANPGWTGATQKAFAGGYYDVSLSNSVRPTVTSTGYTAPLAVIGRPFRTISVQVETFPMFAFPYPIIATGQIQVNGGNWIDAYNSSVNANPATFTSTATVWTNANFNLGGGTYDIDGNVYYKNAPAPSASNVGGTITHSTYTITFSAISVYNYQTLNDNLTGLQPNSDYNSGNMSVTVPNGTNATITSGVYYWKGANIQGTLTTVFQNGMPIVIFDDTQQFQINNGAFVNTSQVPGKLVIWGRNSSNFQLQSATPFYGNLYFRLGQVHLQSVMYGGVAAAQLQMDGTSVLHEDLALESSTNSAVIPFPGTWSSSPVSQ